MQAHANAVKYFTRMRQASVSIDMEQTGFIDHAFYALLIDVVKTR